MSNHAMLSYSGRLLIETNSDIKIGNDAGDTLIQAVQGELVGQDSAGNTTTLT